jgi:hypothetical protein
MTKVSAFFTKISCEFLLFCLLTMLLQHWHWGIAAHKNAETEGVTLNHYTFKPRPQQQQNVLHAEADKTTDCLPVRRVSSLQCSPLLQRRLFPKVWTLTLPSNHNNEQKNTHTKSTPTLSPSCSSSFPPLLLSSRRCHAVCVLYLQISILQLLRLWSWRQRVASILQDFYVWLLLTRGKLLTQSAISSLYLLPWFFKKTLGSSSGLRIEFARDRTVRSPRGVKQKHSYRRPESKSIIRSQIWRCDCPLDRKH